ncbi:MAG: prolyl oligopeptidase family serine peptidase, partial [Ilumatobacteraceae bacterium]
GDPRGSTGHGRAYTDALRGGWGRLDTDDVLAVAEHCQSSGWSTRDTTVVMGSSSGGLVVLNALIGAGPIVAGIALYPVSDLVGLAEHTHRFEAHYTDGLVGPPGSDALVANSPISRAAEISGHLLVMHGTEDPVVPIEHTRRLAAALDPARVEARIVELEDEGHGFRSPENRRLEYDLVGEFLAGVIGRASGLDQDAQ